MRLLWVVLLGLTAAGRLAGAQCEQVVEGVGYAAFGLPQTAMASWHEDRETRLACAGMAGGLGAVAVRRNGAWEVLGGGFVGQVSALVEFQGKLIAAGNFQKVGSVNAARIAAWNGTAWEALGAGLVGEAYSLAVYQGELFVGGNLSQAGGLPVAGLAAWNGSQWRALPSAGSPSVYSLRSFGGSLIAGGATFTVGGKSCSVASFDGTGWTALGAGPSGSVLALEEYGGALIAGTDSSTVANVYQWSGGAWQVVGDGVRGRVSALRSFGGRLFAGGKVSFSNSGTAFMLIASWDGVQWAPAGMGENAIGSINDAVYCMGESEGTLVAGGQLANWPYVGRWGARWTGAEWVSLEPALQAGKFVMGTWNGRFAAAGDFVRVGDQRVNYAMSWSGEKWEPAGDGLWSKATAVGEYQGKLIVGGGAPRSESPVNSVVSAWDGTNWGVLGDLIANSISCFTQYGGELVAIGQISPSGTINARGVAAWDGALWHGFGNGLTGNDLRAGCEFAGKLFVGGSGALAVVSGSAASNIIAWNGAAWEKVGGGVTGAVNALTVWNGKLIVGGQMTMAGATPVANAAAWNGSGWEAMNAPGAVSQLFVYRGSLIALIGSSVMRWNGAAWEATAFSSLGQIAVLGGEIGGYGIASIGFIGRHDLPRYVSGEPMIPTQPRDPVAYCGTSAEIRVIVDNVGTNTPTYKWRKGTTELSDGPTGTGSTLVGVHSAHLRIENVGVADAGGYDVIVENSCGSAISTAATVRPDCCPADLNDDGVVDGADFSIFVAAYNMLDCADAAMPAGCPSDMNRDGVVDDSDFSVFLVGYDEMVCGGGSV
ncbi:MAG: GC-type dockerin domain-anchored protein [Phycisphaerales bacterium]|nr:hypothetical protein [Planctomycetota bacterium]